MSDGDKVDDESLGFGLSEAEIRETARRQFAASIAVAIIIALGVGFAAVMPASRDHARNIAQKSVVAQQPTMTIAPGHRLAATKRIEMELP
jgi:hypothetical protein